MKRLDFIFVFLKGIVIGCADIIPGVSGATIAYIFGIYERLISSLNIFTFSFIKKILSLKIFTALKEIDFSFLIPLAFGIAGGVFLFTRYVPIHYWLVTYPEYVYSAFLGLILAAFLLFLKNHKAEISNHLFLFLIGTCIALSLTYFIPHLTSNEPEFLFLSGFSAISAMILPGISGSYVLLLLGKYSLVIEAIRNLELSVLIPFISGILIGLLIMVKLLSALFKAFHDQTISLMTGFLGGSLIFLWPFQNYEFKNLNGKTVLVDKTMILPNVWDQQFWVCLAITFVSFIVIIGLNQFKKIS